MTDTDSKPKKRASFFSRFTSGSTATAEPSTDSSATANKDRSVSSPPAASSSASSAAATRGDNSSPVAEGEEDEEASEQQPRATDEPDDSSPSPPLASSVSSASFLLPPDDEQREIVVPPENEPSHEELRISARIVGSEKCVGSDGKEFVAYRIAVSTGTGLTTSSSSSSAAASSSSSPSVSGVGMMSGGLSWTILRRFSEFEQLHSALLKEKCVSNKDLLPPLPKKALLRSFDAEYIRRKKCELNKYLEDLVLDPSIQCCVSMNNFLLGSIADLVRSNVANLRSCEKHRLAARESEAERERQALTIKTLQASLCDAQKEAKQTEQLLAQLYANEANHSAQVDTIHMTWEEKYAELTQHTRAIIKEKKTLLRFIKDLDDNVRKLKAEKKMLIREVKENRSIIMQAGDAMANNSSNNSNNNNNANSTLNAAAVAEEQNGSAAAEEQQINSPTSDETSSSAAAAAIADSSSSSSSSSNPTTPGSSLLDSDDLVSDHDSSSLLSPLIGLSMSTPVHHLEVEDMMDATMHSIALEQAKRKDSNRMGMEQGRPSFDKVQTTLDEQTEETTQNEQTNA